MEFVKIVADGSIYYVSKKSIKKSNVLEKALNGTNTDRVFYDVEYNTLYVDSNPLYFGHIVSILRGYNIDHPSNSNFRMDYRYFVDPNEDSICLSDIKLGLDSGSDLESDSDSELEIDYESQHCQMQPSELVGGHNPNQEPVNIYDIDTSVLFSKDKNEIDKLVNNIQDSLSSVFMPHFIDSFSNDKNIINLVKQHIACDDDSDISDQEDLSDLI